jgi:outer membrane autotransporter protein
MIFRRNDVAMSLDMGLDRQIDLLATDMNGNGDDEWDEASAGLNTTSTAGFMSEEWSGPRYSLGASSMQATEPSRIAFATSLQQSRKQTMPPPYALGAHARPPAPAKGKVDVWAEGYYAEFEDDSAGFGQGSDGHTGVLYLGVDYLLSRTMLIGTLIQFDDTEQEFNFLSQRASTNGWMVGPYTTVRLPYNLFFQARAAWGQSDNELTVVPGNEDEFDSERWLVKGTLIGRYKYGLWQIQPRASVGYIEEDQEAYTSSLGPDVPSTTVSLGQAKAGSQVSYRHRLADGSMLEPSVLFEGIWNFHEDAGQINLDDFVTDGAVRGRAEAGLMLYTVGGVAVGGSISYDGIGSDDFSSVGGRARVKVPLN